tara:strand:+ start:108 stop:557 length:450 start_codon:yes stop_codon:yes gene_type:complete
VGKNRSITIKNSEIHETVEIVLPVNIYGAIIEKNCFIGPFTEIQKQVKIYENTRIQSHSFICEKVIIGKDCFIGHGVMFINDRFRNGKRAYGDKNKIEKTEIGNNVLIGSNSTILPVKICDNVVIGAGSVVVKDINVSGTYVGNPAKPI